MAAEELGMLQRTVQDLMRFIEESKQRGQEEMEIANQLKALSKLNKMPQFYFVDKFQKRRVMNAGQAVEWLPNVQSVDCCAVPRAIRDMYSQIECDMFMGLFPEINRAWITIDNRLFLWNYYKGEDFYVYDGLDQLIVSVGLARPRANVFDDEEQVDYVLVISTPVEIVLLKLKIKGHPVYGDIELEPTEYNLASDNIPVRAIAGTRDGRIFMGGHDGSLYEFVYEQEGMLHSIGLKRKCRKVELSGSTAAKWLVPSFIRNFQNSPDPITQVLIDHERQLLYTLSEKSCITLYRLVDNKENNGISFVSTIKNISSALKQYIDQSGHILDHIGISSKAMKDQRIVSLNVISRAESEQIHLVVITHTGVRIFLSTRSRDRTKLNIEYARGPPNKGDLSNILRNGDPGLHNLPSAGPFNRLTQHQIFSHSDTSNGIKPGEETDRPVSCGLFSSGLTLLAFSNAGNGTQEDSSASQPQKTDLGVVCAFSTDMGMRSRHNSLPTLKHFPPLRWTREEFHETIDTDILEQGVSLRQTVVESSGSNVRASQGLPIGRVWAMVEAAFDPTVSDQEEMVYAHMLHAPKPLSTDATANKPNDSSVSTTLSGSKRSSSEISSNGQVASQQDLKTRALQNQSSEPVHLTELSRQHVLPRRYFLVLTSHGLWVLVKNQPINQLHTLLQGPDPGTNADVEEFFKLYGLDESCSMALAIACKTGFPDPVLRDSTQTQPVQEQSNLGSLFAENSTNDKIALSQWVARRAALWFNRIGRGIPSLDPQDSTLKQALPALENTPEGQVDQFGRQTSALLATNPGGDTDANVAFSGCYTGLCLHLFRLLRPFWGWTVVIGASQNFASGRNLPLLQCRWTVEQIQMLLRPLLRLKQFLLSDATFAEAIRDFEQHDVQPGRPSNRVGYIRPSLQTQENERIARLFRLIDRTVQSLLLFELLQSSPGVRFAKVVSLADDEARGKLISMTWEELVTTSDGVSVVNALVKILVQKNSVVDGRELITKLETQCPSFFSQGDALLVSALEDLIVAEQSGQGQERRRFLDSAQQRLHQGFQKLSKDLSNLKNVQGTLKEVYEKLLQLGEPKEAITTVLYCASCYATVPLEVLPQQFQGTEENPQGSGSSLVPVSSLAMRNGRPAGSNSTREKDSLEMREICYERALEILSAFLPKKTSSSPDPKSMSILLHATESKDALWHYTLYDFLLQKGHMDLLLGLNTPYIVTFLADPKANDIHKFGSQIYPEPLHVDMHLLLQAEWFGRHRQDMNAALVFQRLAKLDVIPRDDLDSTKGMGNPNLDQRISYFTRAVSFANAASGERHNGFALDLDLLKDEYDVARLQREVLLELKDSNERLFNRLRGNAVSMEQQEHMDQRSEAEVNLLMNIRSPSSLYNDFAYKFGLWRSCIRIMQECDYNDVEEIHSLYKQIFQDAFSEEEALAESLNRNVNLDALWTKFGNLLRDLGEAFYVSGFNPSKSFVFPVDFLVQGLEDATVFSTQTDRYHNPRNSWVVSALLDIGIPFNDLFDAYTRYNIKIQNGSAPLGLCFLRENHDSFDYSELSKFHIAFVVCRLVDAWADREGRNRVLTDARVGDQLERLLVVVRSLHSGIVDEGNRNTLIQHFERLLPLN